MMEDIHDLAIEAFGDMLIDPIPKKVYVYTQGKRSKKQVIEITDDVDYFRWFLECKIGMEKETARKNLYRYIVLKEDFHMLCDGSIYDHPCYETCFREFNFDYKLRSSGVLKTLETQSGEKFDVLRLKNTIPHCPRFKFGYFILADEFVD